MFQRALNERFIVGAARKTATQIRFGDPTQREKLLLCRRAS
jgi:hypothetical protein